MLLFYPPSEELDGIESFWRDHYEYLKEHGYTLRDRYRPGWVPSWIKDPSKKASKCEDSLAQRFAQVLDATRADGTVVIIKDIKLNSGFVREDIPVGKYFSSPGLAADPRNHCVPILDVIDPPSGSNRAFLVMPWLFSVMDPPFETVGEAIDFFRQIFEGLAFMHENNVAHGDCKWNNFMADAASLFSSPPHPAYPYIRRDFRGKASVTGSRTRTPIRYFLIDFNLSMFCPPQDAPHLRQPPWGGDRSVPEFSLPDKPPCEIYAVDIYCTGNFIRKFFTRGDDHHKAKQGFDFMRELINDMTNPDPLKRPPMTEVVSRFDVLIQRLDDKALRSPYLEVGQELRGMDLWKHRFKHWIYRLRGFPAIPGYVPPRS
ncbi:hypothetical protein H0H93_003387 [Arthromyces matolae]|nr:hypothetical protein H0H93_003387 [Arthromyces matolae]